MARASRRALLAGLAAAALNRPVAAQEDPAVAVVEAFHAGLLDVMQRGATLGFAGRRDVLGPLVAATFDYDTMSRIASGAAWSGMTPAERRALIDAFRAYAVASYAANFDSFSGQSFRTLGVAPARGGRLTVRTELVRPAGRGQPVAFDYLMHETPDGWRAVDVVVNDALSELARRRSEFAGILARGGVAELVRTLEAQTAALGA